MVFFITGASGAGKTVTLEELGGRQLRVVWYDFDVVGVPADLTPAWRQQTTERWLQKALYHQKRGEDVGICGQAVYGEILACPSALQLDGLAVCLLDCEDVVRVDRLRRSGRHVDLDVLSWASWLRLHAVDPQWRPDLIWDNGAPEQRWDRWGTWKGGDPRWQVRPVVDTTDLAVEAVADILSEWIWEQRAHPGVKNPLSQSTARVVR